MVRILFPPRSWRALLFSASLTVFALCAGAADTGIKEAQLQEVRRRIDSIRKAIHADAARRDALATQLKDAELEIQGARERLSDTRKQRFAAEAKLRELQAEHAQTQRQIDQERAGLAGELRVAYMNGREEKWKLLLSQRDPAELGRMMAYYSYFGRARAEGITIITDRLAHLELLAQSIEAETARLRTAEEQHAREVKALSSARERRADTLAAVQSKIRSRSDQLTKLEREAQALEKLIEELRRAIAEFPDLAEQPFQRVKGKLPWPAKGPLLARFGQMRAGGPLKWQGVLIGAGRGTQVRAPFYGRVVYADWLPGLGLLLVLDHGDGYMTLYAHNEQLFRRVGDRVAPGDPLAAIGDSGSSGRPGLYFEIRKGRQAVDPSTWLTKP